MDSAELSGWQALFVVEAEEEERRRDLADGDGEVIEHGHNPDRDVPEDDFGDE
jgi:hypothetical protein